MAIAGPIERTARVRRFRLQAINEGRQVQERALRTCESANKHIERILRDDDFIKTMRSVGIVSAPRLFKQSDERSRSIDPSLRFVIGWSFFFPLFEDAILRKALKKK